MLVIEDLESSEAQQINEFLLNAIYNDELHLNIEDCIFTAEAVEFHEFKNPPPLKIKHDSVVPYLTQCVKCGKDRHDTCHELKVIN